MISTMIPRTANAAWVEMLKDILDNGNLVMSRGLDHKELVCYTSKISMAYPVVTIRPRALGYRFMAMEAYNILTGDNRVSSIDMYSKTVAKFSDDGIYFRGHYGPRIVDQLPYIMETLLKDRYSRQAVLTIWRERPAPSKDIPCLDASTEMWSPEGNVTIKQLSLMFENGLDKYPLFAFDSANKKVVIAYCYKAWKTGVKKRIRLTFDDASTLTLTPDHVLFKKVRRHVEGDMPRTSKTFVEEVRAGSLKVGDRLWATKMFASGPQSRPAYIEDLSQNWSFTNQRKVHTAYSEFLDGKIPVDVDIHHKDGNVWNNSRDNIERISHSEHAASKMFGEGNPTAKETLEQKDVRRLKLRETLLNKGYNVRSLEEYANNHVIVAIEDVDYGEVYDFFVPEFNSAIVGTGVTVHNCTISIQWMIRDNKLHCLDMMRSSDSWLGWPYDIFTFSMISGYLVRLFRARGYDWLTLGDLYLTSGSQHLYQQDLSRARAVVEMRDDCWSYQPFDPTRFPTPESIAKHLKGLAEHNKHKLQNGFLSELSQAWED